MKKLGNIKRKVTAFISGVAMATTMMTSQVMAATTGTTGTSGLSAAGFFHYELCT